MAMKGVPSVDDIAADFFGTRKDYTFISEKEVIKNGREE